jgi:HlyD family secretion protein
MIQEPLATDRALDAAPALRHRRRALVLVVAATLAAAALAWWAWAGAQGAVSAQRLRVAEVTRADLVRDAQASGRAVAAVSPTRYAPAAGTVALAVQAGDAVVLGQVLARIESPALAAERAREAATLAQLVADEGRQRIQADKQRLAAERDADEARLALTATTRELERTRDACIQGVVPQVDCLRTQDAVAAALIRSRHAARHAALEVDGAVFEVRSLAQQLARQRGVVADLDRRLADLAVRSPVAGRVGRVMVADRAAVGPTAPLVTVVDLSRLEVELQVPERFADELGLGMHVALDLAGQPADGVLAAIAPEVLGSQVLVRVRFEGPQPPGLRQNQRVTGRILIEERPDVLTLPRGPFVEALGGHQAYVVQGDTAVRRAITLGAMSTTAVEVVDGLRAGDRVVIDGTDFFADAGRVRLRD